MKLGIMQPYFFPYIGYWQLISAVDEYVIYDDVNFINGGWINRNKVLINGEARRINLQMSGASQNKCINQIEVLYDDLYKKKLLRTIERCYIKAPQYVNAFPVIKKILTQDEKNLAKYLENSIRHICDYLSITTKLIISSTIEKNNDLKGKDKIIEISRLLNADEYINSIGGQALYTYESFAAHGIKLSFLKTGMIEYHQFNNKFVPNLSIIDVMMFNPIEEIKKMLKEYELV